MEMGNRGLIAVLWLRFGGDTTASIHTSTPVNPVIGPIPQVNRRLRLGNNNDTEDGLPTNPWSLYRV